MSVDSSADRAGRRPRVRSVVRGVARASFLLAAVALLSGTSVALGVLPAGASPSMQSTGSSFASVAIQQWVAQASTLYGLNINWQVTSSVIGLNNFALNQVDFAASDIPYSSGQATSSPSVPYQYMPDVAGGLAFMYNLTGNDGQRITSLVLNAAVADDIFLGKIVYWDDSAIKGINQNLAPDLPHTKIIPVYRSDASGENYLLSDYMLHQDPGTFNAAQNAFQSAFPGQPNASWPTPSTSVNVGSPPFSTTYPGWAQNNLVGQSGSDNAANYVAALSSEGAITYVETAYAKEHAFPVASVLNVSGAAVQPTSFNVATALEAAILHADLTQDLSNVYTNPKPNAYPLSAYSYLVTQCSPPLASGQKTQCASGPNGTTTFPTQKGQALGQFVTYLACAGQDQMASLGYSPLPPNLVLEDFYAVNRLAGGSAPTDVTAANCRNPYVDGSIPLPGEPIIQGVVNPIAGLNPTASGTSPGAGGGAAGAAGSGTSGAAGSTAGGAGGAGSGSGSGGAGANGVPVAGAKSLSAAQIAAGYRIVNGQVVKLSSCEGAKRFTCAAALVNATEGINGVPLGAWVGWLVVALVVFGGIPLLVYMRRRRALAGGPEPAEAVPAEVRP